MVLLFDHSLHSLLDRATNDIISGLSFRHVCDNARDLKGKGRHYLRDVPFIPRYFSTDNL